MMALSRCVLATFLAIAASFACTTEAPTRPPYEVSGAPSSLLPIGNSPTGPSATDGGDAGAVDASGDTCTDLAADAKLVDRIAEQGEPPDSTGGTVTDGTYDLSNYVVYVGVGTLPGPTGISARATIRIAAGVIERVFETGGNSPPQTTRSKSRFTLLGATFTDTAICPATHAAQSQYTAREAEIVFVDLVTKEAFTFVKR